MVSQTAAAVLGASPLALSTNNATNLGRKCTTHRLMQGVNVGYCYDRCLLVVRWCHQRWMGDTCHSVLDSRARGGEPHGCNRRLS